MEKKTELPTQIHAQLAPNLQRYEFPNATQWFHLFGIDQEDYPCEFLYFYDGSNMYIARTTRVLLPEAAHKAFVDSVRAVKGLFYDTDAVLKELIKRYGK